MNLEKLWVSMKAESARNGKVFSERKYLQRVREQVTEEWWRKHCKKIDRVEAGLPHHLSGGWDPERGPLTILKWCTKRYRLIFGELKCQHCGSQDGPLFRKALSGGITQFSKCYRFCSDSCSKASDGASQKRQATSIQKYGAPNVAQSAHFQRKIRIVNKRNDREFYERRLEKTRTTKVKIHGSLEAAEAIRAEKMKATNQRLYGGNAATCSRKVRAKVRETNLRRYGVENPSQDAEIMGRIVAATSAVRFLPKEITIRGRRYTGLQGYEPKFLAWYDQQGGRQRFETKPKSVPYKLGKKQKWYHPDLKVVGANTLVEVKSVYTAAIKGEPVGYGSYKRMRLKFAACVENGFKIYLAVMHNGNCFLREGLLPTKKQLRAEFKTWLQQL